MLLCWLALLVIRVAERATNTSWRRIALELGPVHEVTLERAAGTVTQTTELTGRQRDLLRACQVEPPARITHLDPA